MIQKPEFLQKGDLVYIVSPASPIQDNHIRVAKELLSSWGLRVHVSEYAYARSGVFAGTDEQRLHDLQTALDNPDCKAILCSRGGYGSIRIASCLDFTAYMQNPKWIIGFSDITVLLARCNALDIASVHALMAKNVPTAHPSSLESLRQLLFGSVQTIEIQPSAYNIPGQVTGEIVGGNLSVLYSMRGIPFEFDYTNKILFIEDLHEYLYHIDRIMQNFKLSGIFDTISGLVVGHMSNMKQGADPHKDSLEEIILSAVTEYSIPVCFSAPIGHEPKNMAIMIGGTYSLDITPEKVRLEYYR